MVIRSPANIRVLAGDLFDGYFPIALRHSAQLLIFWTRTTLTHIYAPPELYFQTNFFILAAYWDRAQPSRRLATDDVMSYRHSGSREQLHGTMLILYCTKFLSYSANCVCELLISNKQQYLPYFTIFCNFGRNDNPLVRKTKKQMVIKHMKLWNNRILHSSFHPGQSGFSKSEFAGHRILLVMWKEFWSLKRKLKLQQKKLPTTLNNKKDIRNPAVNDRNNTDYNSQLF